MLIPIVLSRPRRCGHGCASRSLAITIVPPLGFLVVLALAFSVGGCGDDDAARPGPDTTSPTCVDYTEYQGVRYTSTPGSSYDVAVAGKYLYVAAGASGLVVLDAAVPPVVKGSADTPGTAQGVTVSGTHAYVADGRAGLQVVDVSNPAGPWIQGSAGVEDTLSSWDVAVAGGVAYMALGPDWGEGSYSAPRDLLRHGDSMANAGGRSARDAPGGLQVIDVSHPAAPVTRSVVIAEDWAYGVAVSGHYAYLACANWGLKVIDVSDPDAPSVVADVALDFTAFGVDVEGTYAYLSGSRYGFAPNFRVFDVSNPSDPADLGGAWIASESYGLDVEGPVACVAEGVDGVRVFDVSDPAHLNSVARVNAPALRVAIGGDHAYMAGLSSNVGATTLSRLAAPVFCNVSLPSYATDIAVSGKFVFVTDEAGFRVIDATTPRAAKIVGSIDALVGALAVSGSRACVAGAPGMSVIDVSTPAHPAVLGEVDTPGDAMDVALAGETAYVADGPAGLRVVDVSNPSSPQILGGVDTPATAERVVMAGTYAYLADNDYGDSRLYVVDVSNPASPTIAGSMSTPGPVLCVAVSGSLAYLVAPFGLQIADISAPSSPTVLGSIVFADGSASSVALSDEAVYLVNGEGVNVIDAKNPSAPVIVARMNVSAVESCIACANDLLYVATVDDGSVQILPSHCAR